MKMNMKNTSNCLFTYQNESAEKIIRLKKNLHRYIEVMYAKARHEPY